MDIKEAQAWAAEKYGLQQTAVMITGKPIKIRDVERSMKGELGYTGPDKTIYLAYEHPLMNGLTDSQKRAFRKGVACHEMMHQVFTDFSAYEKTLKKLDPKTRRIFSIINNCLEDPAIEYWAPTVVGGTLLSSLRFSIAHIYKTAPRIEEDASPMGQFLSALIQFGDMGVLKGYFTSPEAKHCFAEAAPLFEEGITESKCSKRIAIAEKITEISKPLWQAEADFEEMLSELLKSLEKNGKNEAKGSGKGKDGDASSIPETKKDKRRKITIKKVSKEEYEEAKANSSSSSVPEDGDITVLVCDEKDEEKSENMPKGKGISIPSEASKDDSDDEESASAAEKEDEENGESETPKSSSNTSSDSCKSATSQSSEADNSTEEGGSKTKEEDTESSSESQTGDSKSPASNTFSKEKGGEAKDSMSGEPSESKSEESEISDQPSSTETNSSFKDRNTGSGNGEIPHSPAPHVLSEEEEADYRIDNEEYSISEEDIAAIIKENESNIEKMLKVEEREKEDSSALPDYDTSSARSTRKSCLNYRITYSERERDALIEEYQKVTIRLAAGIASITNQLKRIFKDDQEEREYSNSGRINLKRMSSGKMTSRMFDRKRSPADKSNMAIEILVDESGSMRSNGKYIAARECCIALAEVFNNLNVPLYIIGFTADCIDNDDKRYGVVHAHYITWKNNLADRVKLLNIAARANNADGHSIRYASEVLRKKEAKNKLLIVISDGQPAAYDYPNGIEDTKDAIREAKKSMSVLGVAVGNNDTDTIRGMYGSNFMHIEQSSDLFTGLSAQIKSIIKKW